MKQLLECRDVIERLTEAARAMRKLDSDVKAHLQDCEACRERWADERRLAAGMRALRAYGAISRTSESVRDSLMREFETRQQIPVKVRTMPRQWAWGLAAAAAVLMSLAAVRQFTVKPVQPVVAERQTEPSEMQQEGFIEVPYAPPLAPGELIRVVHTELQPAALASLGVNVDPAWTTELPADLLVGQDGFPRAVRVSDDNSDSGGF